ncbi:hypothetical protein [Palleronia sediminis]|uniref:hypothetical protein n=1 Tax=Palleronia sediminis TaxID=2547833 RepID=UPI0014555078|nr:hypothetical protein [Palleronia sediminis]
MTLISTLRDRARRRAEYARTLRELRAMPVDTALDLDIYHGDARAIAARAVYG